MLLYLFFNQILATLLNDILLRHINRSDFIGQHKKGSMESFQEKSYPKENVVGENVPLTYSKCSHAWIQIFFSREGLFTFARGEVVVVKGVGILPCKFKKFNISICLY